MDFTWFFPVGSKVKHSKFGEGVVLKPPSPTKMGNMLVLVKFPNRRTAWIFGARHGSESNFVFEN